MLPQIGLYYPYIRFRDDAWLKAAALYWPQLARIVPVGHPPENSPTVRTLSRELDFLVDVDPSETALRVAPLFVDVVTQHAAELRRRYQVEDRRLTVGTQMGPIPTTEPASPDPSFVVGFRWEEVDPDLYLVLRRHRLVADISGPFLSGPFTRHASPSHRVSPTNPAWVYMASMLAWVYKCVMIDDLARHGGFAPTTDQTDAHLAAGAWDADRIARVLLGSPDVRHTNTADPVSALGLLAVRIVLPADLHNVPVEKIVALRTRHRAEFEAFSREITDAIAELRTELTDVTLPEARERYTDLHVERRFELPLQELRRALRSARLDAGLGTVNLKFDLPVTLAALGGGALTQHPLLGTAAGAGFALAGLTRSAAQQRRTLTGASPVAYLLSIEQELTPHGLLDRLRR